MTADYYPRLAKVCDNREEMISTVNKQSEVLFGLGTPILALMIVFSNLIIKILLTNEFLVIVSVIKLLCVGSLMQIFSYPIGHISFAKGDKNFFSFMREFLVVF
ncbi:oligosaccharide flippase family protein [Bacteroides fragilis]|nr:oligosaccharide flippase family protein [Bacteroides fragilis]